MPNIPFYMAGEIGIVKDVAPHELPPQAWSGGMNVGFRNGKVFRRDGQQQVYSGHLGQPYWLGLVYTQTQVYWVYADSTKLYATDGGAHADVTRVSGVYSAMDLNRLWDGTMFGGIPVYTNGKDKPQAWLAPGLGTDFVDLPNWTAANLARVLRPYKSFLVAMGVSKGGVYYPNLVWWSHPADPGSVPISWDITDPTKLAGELDLVDEYVGGIRDALPLRDALIIYKDNAIWGLQFIGGTSVMRAYQILGGMGTLGPHCATQVNQGRQHMFATNDDLVVFDGQNPESVLDKKFKRHLEATMEMNVAERSFVFALERRNEAYFCYPELGNQFPNMAIIWNWRDNTITQRALPALTSYIATGPIVISGDPWDLDLATWDSDATIWDLAMFRASAFDILMAQPGTNLGTSKLAQMGVQQTNDGVNYNAYIERTDIALIGQDYKGQPKADFERRKLAKRIWPHIEGSPVQVSVGSQETLGGGVTYAAAQTFTPGVDKYLDFLVNGLFIAVKFESTLPGTWELDGYNLEIEPLGNLG